MKFKELFQSQQPWSDEDLESLLTKKVSYEDNNIFSRMPSNKEIKGSVWDLHPVKSPGPDGFSRIFFRKDWEIMKDKLIVFVKECFRVGRIPETVNKTFLILIPKMEKASIFNHFCPISLCNFSYKVVAKILANRLSEVVEKLVSPNQGAFVKGRWIAENSVLAQEVIHKVKKHKGKK